MGPWGKNARKSETGPKPEPPQRPKEKPEPEKTKEQPKEQPKESPYPYGATGYDPETRQYTWD